MITRHIPVLLDEVMEKLNLHNGTVAVDATLGGGGHTREMLSRVLPGGRVIAVDVDESAIRRFIESAKDDTELASALGDGRCVVVRDNFSRIEETLRGLGIGKVDAILADFGFSSDQVELPHRGFSFMTSGPLDMRLNQGDGMTAAEVINTYDEESLTKILFRYGGELKARKIARALIARRGMKPFAETTDFAECIKSVFSPMEARRMKTHPATRTFQAIRMEVNDELGSIERFIRAAIPLLAPSGRLAVISFHSGEDALVKKIFQEFAKGCVCPRDFPECRCGQSSSIRFVPPRFVRPSGEEIEKNPRSRSATLRVVEKLR